MSPDLNIPSQFNSNDFMNFFTDKIDNIRERERERERERDLIFKNTLLQTINTLSRQSDQKNLNK